MFTCPSCQATLARVEGPYGVSWSCPRCGGRAVGLGLLGRTPVHDYVNRVWIVARLKPSAGGRLCPVCGSAMVEVPSLPDYVSPVLDVCRRCYLFWFDPSEFEQVPAVSAVRQFSMVGEVGAAASRELSDLPESARETVALVQAQAAAAQIQQSGWATAGPDAWWQWIPGVLGLPVELERGLARLPWATWTLAALITAVSVVAFFDLRRAVEVLGLIPEQADRYFGLTLLTSFFLHGGILHLLGNLYFLLLFGDNVEDYLGHRRFLLLVGFATLLGAIAHIALDPRSQIPVIGASGGISGLVVFYGLEFPRARLGFLIRWVFRWIQIPAWVFVGLWIVMQLVTAWRQVAGLSSVSALAHLGGAAVGVWFWLTWGRARPVPSRGS